VRQVERRRGTGGHAGGRSGDSPHAGTHGSTRDRRVARRRRRGRPLRAPAPAGRRAGEGERDLSPRRRDRARAAQPNCVGSDPETGSRPTQFAAGAGRALDRPPTPLALFPVRATGARDRRKRDSWTRGGRSATPRRPLALAGGSPSHAPDHARRCTRMKRLYLLRHAKSSWNDPALPDHKRPFTGRGRRAAKAIGRHLSEQGIEPEMVLCSTARRARHARPDRVGARGARHQDRAGAQCRERERAARSPAKRSGRDRVRARDRPQPWPAGCRAGPRSSVARAARARGQVRDGRARDAGRPASKLAGPRPAHRDARRTSCGRGTSSGNERP
jgi:hypothetical protein